MSDPTIIPGETVYQIYRDTIRLAKKRATEATANGESVWVQACFWLHVAQLSATLASMLDAKDPEILLLRDDVARGMEMTRAALAYRES